MRRTFKQLLGIFRKLGAANPEGWARSETEDGIPQLSRFIFLREAWKQSVIADDDVRWIKEHRRMSKRNPDAPLAGVGQALERILGKGADPKDLAEVVRGMQYSTLFSLCYLLADPGELEPEVADVGWLLCETDGSGKPVAAIDCLHESVLTMDPT